MKKDIKDYIHLYLGCEAYVFPDDTLSNGWLDAAVKNMPALQYKIPVTLDRVKHIIERGYKLILRPLSDMTEEERLHWFNRVKKDGETLDESVWTTELNGQPCDPHWTLWMNERWNGCRCAYTVGINDHFTAEEFVWLLSKSFDLFGLIEAGLAIDRSKLERGGKTITL